MRLFIAIELPQNVRGHLAAIQQRIRQAECRDAKVSWVASENLHITVKFLGDVSSGVIMRLEGELSRAVRVPALQLVVDGFLCLPVRGPTRVIAAKVIGSMDALMRLHREIEEICAAEGIARDERAFVPHVTLGRIKSNTRRSWSDILKRNHERSWPGPPFKAGSFVLVHSNRAEMGPLYVSIARFPLMGMP